MNKTVRIALICGSALHLAGAELLATAGEARAENVFTKVVAFGDSWADTGNFFKILGVSLPQYPTGRFSGGTNYVDTTALLLGIPQISYAIGGATTGSTNLALPGIPGFAQQWQGFIAAGQTIAPTDIVTLNIGGNDVRAYYQGGGTLAGVPAVAATSASQALAGVNALVGAGARTLVVTTGDTGAAPSSVGTPLAAIGTAYSRDYNGLMQAGLATIARNGVRVELIDTAMIVNQIKASPALYGVANVGVCPAACVGAPALQDKYLYYFDGTHPTSRGFAIFASYIVNRLNAPLTFAPQGDLALSAAAGFASTLFGRLDLFREASVPAPSSAAAKGLPAPVSGRAPIASPWSFYMQANGAIGERSASAASVGYKFDSVGGTLGLEYRINNNAFIGAAFDYANPKAQLLNGAGNLDANSYQFGLYGAWADANFFVQGLATIGRQDARNTRPGVVDTLSSRPDGATAVAAGKLGYLFDIGLAQAGPIGSLTYAWARVNGYSEIGDPALALRVGPQVAQALVGSLGAQLRVTVRSDDKIITPYLNLTVEDDLVGNGRIIAYQATSAPLVVNAWTIPGGPSQIYGRVAGGLAATVNASVALSATLSRTLGRRGGDDFYGSGAIRISF
jgi:outer membrane lipase/esterase